MTKSEVQCRKVAKSPNSRPYSEIRSREYLSEDEVKKVIKGLNEKSRNGHRDSTLVLLMFRHALRVSELMSLKWDQIDFINSIIHVKRIKNGINSTHPIGGTELRSLKRLKRKSKPSSYVFVTERGTPFTSKNIHNVVKFGGEYAELSFPIHPHMLRHSTGFYLANKGHDTRSIQVYMGHKNIKNTVIYTELTTDRFQNFWDD